MLWNAPQPVWLWDIARQRIVWANQACLDFSGARAMDDLLRLKFSPEAPFIKQLAVLSMYKTELEGIKERIRFPVEGGDIVFDCLCEHVEFEPGRVCVLVKLVEDLGKVASEPAQALNGIECQQTKNGVLKSSDHRPEGEHIEPKVPPIDPPQTSSGVKSQDNGIVQILNFEGGGKANGFVVEAGQVDEEDLLILREIARMINGPIELGPTELGATASAKRPRGNFIASCEGT